MDWGSTAMITTVVKPGILSSTFHFPEMMLNLITSIVSAPDLVVRGSDLPLSYSGKFNCPSTSANGVFRSNRVVRICTPANESWVIFALSLWSFVRKWLMRGSTSAWASNLMSLMTTARSSSLR